LVTASSRRTVGADVFVEWDGDAQELGRRIESTVGGTPLQLKIIDNRGTRVYPPTGTPTDCVDAWRCRFITREGGELADADLLELLGRLTAPAAFTHVEKLHVFDGEDGFTKAQGED
jgi:isocitrate dehydrogenase